MSIVRVPPITALLVLRRRSSRSTLIWSSTPSCSSNSSPAATVSRVVSPTNWLSWKTRARLRNCPRRHVPGGRGPGDGLEASDVPRMQLGQGLVQPAPRGGQGQLDGRPVLSGLLRDLGQVADGQLLAIQRQVIQRPPGSA